ncbi:MAG: flagellar protein FlgN [Anaerolineae bacterium]|nr:flagellar protein FlgN [Anaerolineae bacterium]
MTTPNNNVEELYRVLSEQIQTYHQLVELAYQERIALEAEDFSRLADITQFKEGVVKTAAQWDDARTKITIHLADQLKISNTTSLLDIITQLDKADLSVGQEVKDQLNEIRQEFANLMQQLLLLYSGNRILLEAGLVRINATFDYISSAALSGGGHYTSKGRSQVAFQAAGNMLNWKA